MSDQRPEQMSEQTASRRFIPLGNKLILTAVLILAVATVAVYVGLSRYEREKTLSAKEQAARMAGELFFRSVSVPVIFDDPTGIKDTVALLSQDPEILGVELWRVAAEKDLGPALSAQLRQGASGVPARLVQASIIERGADRLILRAPIRDPDNKIIAVAAVQYSLVREMRAFELLRRRILLCAAGMASLLSLFLGLLTRRWITRPLSLLLGSVKRMEAGDRSLSATSAASDEVGRLFAAFSRMAQAVARREEDILKRNAEMKLLMDNAAQGFLAVTRQGVLLPEHSAILETWFGPWPQPQPQDDPPPFWDYLPGAKVCKMLWSNVDGDCLPLELALEILPGRLVAGERIYQLAFRPIAGTEETILIVVSDITLEVAQERAKVEQQEMIGLFQAAVRDRDGLRGFLADAERLVQCILHEDAEQDKKVLARDIHTLKGNSGMYGQATLVGVCQAIEDQLAAGQVGVGAAERQELLSAWDKVEQRRRLLLGDAATDELTLSKREQQALLRDIAKGAPREELHLRVQNLALETAGKRLGRLADQTCGLARRLGKGDIVVTVEAAELRLPEQPLGEFFGVFSHLLRNAIDHGLETPEERQKAGKSPAGQVTLRMLLDEGGLRVEVADDGRGIAWDRLRARAEATGLPAQTRDDLVAALFTDGVSTREAVTEISGRGVGMGAVAEVCRRLSATIRVESETGVGTTFSFCFPRSILGLGVSPRPAIRASLPPQRPAPELH